MAEHALNAAQSYFGPPAACPADLNTDGTRGIDDLLVILASFDGAPLQGGEDLTDDGFVGVDDVLAFLLYYNTSCD